jgi:hypothetical protein
MELIRKEKKDVKRTKRIEQDRKEVEEILSLVE